MTHHANDPDHVHEPGAATHDDSHAHLGGTVGGPVTVQDPHAHVAPPVQPTVVTPPVVTTPPVHEHAPDVTGYAAIKYTALVIITLAILYFLAVYVIPALT